jgi:hypothetical protein
LEQSGYLIFDRDGLHVGIPQAPPEHRVHLWIVLN